VVRRDEQATGADVLREAGVEVVIALEIDLDLEIEALGGANVLNVLCHFGPRGVHEGMAPVYPRLQGSSALQNRPFDRMVTKL
jgi:hypothetical protein